MSIILDALKKAEKERGGSEGSFIPPGSVEETPPPEKKQVPVFNPILTDTKKSIRKKPQLIVWIAPVIILVLGGLVTQKYIRLFSKTHTAMKATTPVKAPPPVVAEDPDAVRAEALKLFKEFKFDESTKKWLHVIELAPEDAEAYNNLGVIQKKLGKKEDAERSYAKALGFTPNYPEALNNLGILYMEQNKTTEAKPLFQKAISINADYAEPHFHLAILLERDEIKQEAADHYSRFLDLSSELDAKLKGQIEMRISLLRLGSENNN